MYENERACVYVIIFVRSGRDTIDPTAAADRANGDYVDRGLAVGAAAAAAAAPKRHLGTNCGEILASAGPPKDVTVSLAAQPFSSSLDTQ